MDLWTRDIQPLAKRLQGAPQAEFLRLSVEIIDWTLRTSPEQINDERAAGCISEIMAAARSAVARNEDDFVLSQELLDRLDEANEGAYEGGVPQLLSGVEALFSSPRFSYMDIEAICYDCLEFTSQREEDNPQTLEEQEANPRMVEVAAFQKQLLAEAIARRSQESGE